MQICTVYAFISVIELPRIPDFYPKISAYYSKPSNQEKLAHTIHQNLLPLMSDCNMAIQDIYILFIQDDSISDAKKKNLTPLYKPASSRLLFLAKLISFGMERQFIKRNLAGGSLSPIVLDYIMDSEVPKPCRHFIGRDKEMEKLPESVKLIFSHTP